MAKFKFTEDKIRDLPLPASGKDEMHFCTSVPGLALRVTGGGSKTFYFVYVFDGRYKRHKLIRWVDGESTRAEAKTMVAAHAASVARGVDPAQDEKEKSQARKATRMQAAREITVGRLCERYEAEHAIHKRSKRADERRIRRYVLPAWSARKAKSITRTDVKELIAPLLAAGKKAEAQHVRALVSGIYGFAVAEEIVDVNPCAGIKVKKEDRVQPRERALETAREFRAFWVATEPGPKLARRTIYPEEAAALRLMLLTGCRPSEAAELPWSELDLEEGTWTLPGSRSKNKRENMLPLLPVTLDLLRARAGNGSAYVFPAQRKKGGATDQGRLSRALRIISKRLTRLGIASFTPHDLRRSVETGMAASKVPKEYRDRVLNHVDSSVGGRHYNKHDYLDEKREALEKWHRRLDTMLRGHVSNVVPIRVRG